MIINLPIYRADEVSTGKTYDGFLKSEDMICFEESYSARGGSGLRTRVILIDPRTLAVHFPDKMLVNFPYMLDVNGDKVFASLIEDGGDIIVADDGHSYAVKFYGGACYVVDIDENTGENPFKAEYGRYHTRLLSNLGSFKIMGRQK